VVVVTEEDDRDEDGAVIQKQIAKGAEAQGKQLDKNLFLVADRSEAISFAINQAHKGDTVLFLGKGHEKTIERAHETIDWNEAETVRAAIRARLNK